MSKIPKQRTGSGGWPDRRRVPAPSGGKKGCAVTAVAVAGGVGATVAAAAYGTAHLVTSLIGA